MNKSGTPARSWVLGAPSRLLSARSSEAAFSLVPKAMVLNVGSPGEVFVVWIFGGILSLFGALTYAELAAAMPEAGGEYVYLRTAYGPFFGFLYGWTQTWVAKSGSIATLATLFSITLRTSAPALERCLVHGSTADRPERRAAGGAPGAVLRDGRDPDPRLS